MLFMRPYLILEQKPHLSGDQQVLQWNGPVRKSRYICIFQVRGYTFPGDTIHKFPVENLNRKDGHEIRALLDPQDRKGNNLPDSELTE